MNNEDFFEAESQVGGTQRHPIQRLNFKDAMSYLRQVKSKFGNDHLYYDFIEILKKFHSGSIDLPAFTQNISDLFRDHPDLIVRLNNYLPPENRIEVQLNQQVCGSKDYGLESDFQALVLETRNPLESQVGGMQSYPIQKLKLKDQISYMRQVKSTFQNDYYVYYDFLDSLKEFHSGSIDFPEFIQTISSLFRDHPDLIIGFNNFLSPENRIEVQPNQQVQVSPPGTNLGGGATSGATSLTIHPGGSPTATIHSTHGSQYSHSPSPRSLTGNAEPIYKLQCPLKDYKFTRPIKQDKDDQGMWLSASIQQSIPSDNVESAAYHLENDVSGSLDK